MKLIQKLGFTALITASVSAASFAQMYGGVHAGYALPTANGVLGTTNVSNSTASPATSTSENIYGTGGGGFSAGLNFGYMFSKHFGLDIAGTYIGSTPTVTNSTDATFTGGTRKVTVTSTGSQIRVTPSLVVSAGGEGISPYARFGVAIPVGGEGATDYKDVTTLANTSYTKTYTVKSAGQLSIGFNSAIGVNIPFGEKMSIFGELALTTLSIKGKSATYTAYSDNTPTVFGTPALTTAVSLSDRKSAQNNINFVDKLDNTSNNSTFNPTVKNLAGDRVSGFDTDKPSDVLATTSNNNSIGLMVGLRYKF
jgi:hypothetical protein